MHPLNDDGDQPTTSDKKKPRLADRIRLGASAMYSKLEKGVIKVKNSDFAHKVKESKAFGTIARGGKAVGGFIVDKSQKLGSKIDAKIMQNEKLARAKTTTIEKAGKAGMALKTGFDGLLGKKVDTKH